MKVVKGLMIATLALQPLISGAEDQAPANNNQVTKAVRLADRELDRVTAGGAFTVTEVSNPGAANELKFLPNGSILCVNCFGASTPDSKTVLNSGNAQVLNVLQNGRSVCINC